MRLLATVLAVAAVAAAVNVEAEFAKWRAQHRRLYGSPDEAKRLRCFGESLAAIERHSAANPSATFGTNEHSDLCFDEFAARYLGASDGSSAPPRPQNEARMTRAEAERVLRGVDAWDWRQKGAVTPVKNQGSCGSCWAFSATGNMEAQHFFDTGDLVGLSEQQLVSCDTTDSGCSGGWMPRAYTWLMKNGGSVAETDYPYVSGTGTNPKCDPEKAKKPVVKVSTWQAFPRYDEVTMAAALYRVGPLAIAVHADSVWQHYTGGIVTKQEAGNVNHGVLAVGFGVADGTPYWIIKNSWGEKWGEEGYMRLQRGVDMASVTALIVTALTGSHPNGTCLGDCLVGGDEKCCYGTCCKDKETALCCGSSPAGGPTCCNSTDVCCPGHDIGSGGGCCPSKDKCCGTDGCCAHGECISSKCCPQSRVCGKGCCDKASCCSNKDGTVKSCFNPSTASCCEDGSVCVGGKCCGSGCCKAPYVCDGNQCVCPKELQCGAKGCCANASACCKAPDGQGVCLSSYQKCCPTGSACSSTQTCCGKTCCSNPEICSAGGTCVCPPASKCGTSCCREGYGCCKGTTSPMCYSNYSQCCPAGNTCSKTAQCCGKSCCYSPNVCDTAKEQCVCPVAQQCGTRCCSGTDKCCKGTDGSTSCYNSTTNQCCANGRTCSKETTCCGLYCCTSSQKCIDSKCFNQ